MTDFESLMRVLSTPRPNGSRGEETVREALADWLQARGIPFTRHRFRQYPYFYEAIGLWLIFSRTLLAVAIWLGWGWWALLIAAIGVLGGLVDSWRGWHLITWPGAREGQNIIIGLGPQNARQEMVFSAHYDTKTELLDHRRRQIFIRSIPMGVALTLALGVMEPLRAWLALQQHVLAPWVHGVEIVLTLPLLFLAWGLGLHLSLGRMIEPSQGAVDNGAACAILMKLAERIKDAPPTHTRVTIALFSGEEVDRQGSRAWVKDRSWPAPTQVVNLELMGQNGSYVIWRQDGDVFRAIPTSPRLNALLAQSIAETTGEEPQTGQVINSDAYPFLLANIPATTMGTLAMRYGAGGLHRPTDNLQRVVMERLPQGVDILLRLLQHLEDQEAGASIAERVGQGQ